MVSLLGELTSLETPSDDPELLARFAERAATLFSEVGNVSVVERGGLPHVSVEFGRPNGEPVPLVLTHYDTVWPRGTIRARPFAVNGDQAWGPGVYDLKAGAAIAYMALCGLAAHRRSDLPAARVLLCADEERGNLASVGLIQELSRRSSAALVLEPPLDGGRLKTRRKGIANAVVSVRGRAAHAASAPGEGVSAALEIAQLAQKAAKLADPARGVSVNIGVLTAGGQRNVVAATASMELDIRAPDAPTLERTLERLHRLRPTNKEALIFVDAEIHRPPWERTPDAGVLVMLAAEVGGPLGLQLGEGASGGGSEANLTAAVGTPTIDGLGAAGHGAHAENERVDLPSLFDRTALLAGLIASLQGGLPPG
jgi:glutamate carboxypeptidase